MRRLPSRYLRDFQQAKARMKGDGHAQWDYHTLTTTPELNDAGCVHVLLARFPLYSIGFDELFPVVTIHAPQDAMLAPTIFTWILRAEKKDSYM